MWAAGTGEGQRGRGAAGRARACGALTWVDHLEAHGLALVQVAVMVVQVAGVQPRVRVLHACVGETEVSAAAPSRRDRGTPGSRAAYRG